MRQRIIFEDCNGGKKVGEWTFLPDIFPINLGDHIQVSGKHCQVINRRPARAGEDGYAIYAIVYIFD